MFTLCGLNLMFYSRYEKNDYMVKYLVIGGTSLTVALCIWVILLAAHDNLPLEDISVSFARHTYIKYAFKLIKFANFCINIAAHLILLNDSSWLAQLCAVLLLTCTSEAINGFIVFIYLLCVYSLVLIKKMI